MKKLILSITFLSLAAVQVNAQQISENALGLRFGGNNGFGAEISYQRALEANNRLEADLGIRTDDDFRTISLTGIYQWVWDIDGAFNWYAGVGAGVGTVDYDDDYRNDNYRGDTQVYIYGAGNIGIEYSFDFPLLVSLDMRPQIGSGNFNNDIDLDLALSARYKF